MARREYGYRRENAGDGTRFAAGPVEMEPEHGQPGADAEVTAYADEDAVVETAVVIESQDAASLADFAPHLVQEEEAPVVEDEPEPEKEAPVVEDASDPEPEPEKEPVVESKDETSELDPVESDDVDSDDEVSADDAVDEEAESETSWQ